VKKKTSGRLIKRTQRHLPYNTDTHKSQTSMPRRRNTTAQSQQASSCRPTP